MWPFPNFEARLRRRQSLQKISTQIPIVEYLRCMAGLQHVALSQVALFAQGLEISFGGLAAEAPRLDMIDMQQEARLQSRARSTSAT